MKRLAAAQYPRLPLSDNCQTIVGLRLPLLTFLWNSVRWCWTCLKAKNPHRTVTLVIVNVFIIKCSVDNTMCQQTRETRVLALSESELLYWRFQFISIADPDRAQVRSEIVMWSDRAGRAQWQFSWHSSWQSSWRDEGNKWAGPDCLYHRHYQPTGHQSGRQGQDHAGLHWPLEDHQDQHFLHLQLAQQGGLLLPIGVIRYILAELRTMVSW